MTKTKAERLFESQLLVYKTASENYRYFLNWRQKLTAGYLTSLVALAVAYNWTLNLKDNSSEWGVFILGSSIVLTLLFWVLEFRNRDLYRICQNVAKSLERQFGNTILRKSRKDSSVTEFSGVYDELIETPPRLVYHSAIMNAFFGLPLLVLVVIMGISLSKPEYSSPGADHGEVPYRIGECLIRKSTHSPTEIIRIVAVGDDTCLVFSHFISQGRLLQAEDYVGKAISSLDDDYMRVECPIIDGRFSPDKYLDQK